MSTDFNNSILSQGHIYAELQKTPTVDDCLDLIDLHIESLKPHNILRTKGKKNVEELANILLEDL